MICLLMVLVTVPHHSMVLYLVRVQLMLAGTRDLLDTVTGLLAAAK